MSMQVSCWLYRYCVTYITPCIISQMAARDQYARSSLAVLFFDQYLMVHESKYITCSAVAQARHVSHCRLIL